MIKSSNHHHAIRSRVLRRCIIGWLVHWTCTHYSYNPIEYSLILSLNLAIAHLLHVRCFIMTCLVSVPSKWWLSIDDSSCLSKLVLVTLKVLVYPIYYEVCINFGRSVWILKNEESIKMFILHQVVSWTRLVLISYAMILLHFYQKLKN